MNARFEELMGRYLDGSASADEVRQLDEWIQRDPAAQEDLFQTAAVEVGLRRLLANPLARPLADGNRRGPAPPRESTPDSSAAADPALSPTGS